MRGQDEPNRALCLATRVGKMELSCLLGTTHRVSWEKFPQKLYNKSFIDQACSVKMAGYWPHSFLASLWTSTPSRSINTQKKNLANIQPSWPHTWPITHISYWAKWRAEYALKLFGQNYLNWNSKKEKRSSGWSNQLVKIVLVQCLARNKFLYFYYLLL